MLGFIRVEITAKARNKQHEVGQCLDGAEVGKARDSSYIENEDVSLCFSSE